MTTTATWPDPVVAFFREQMPRDVSGRWDHFFSSAYQMGAMALVALGQADKDSAGAVAKEHPKIPDILPRWDDICCAVLSLLHQRGEIEYRLQDGSRYERRLARGEVRWRPLNPPAIPAPNVRPAHNCGPAYIASARKHLLEALDLVEDIHWSANAELVFWRTAPHYWFKQLAHDPRYLTAFELCLTSLPEEEADQIAALVNVSDADVEEALGQHKEWLAEKRAQYGPKARLGGAPTPERTRHSLTFARESQIEWLFFRGWRLLDGWLSADDRKQALEIFHDPLAQSMRRDVIQRLHPDSDVAKFELARADKARPK
ncbi:MAG: hypothetical protein AAGH68_07375 [Pseudomonadota bacterium]